MLAAIQHVLPPKDLVLQDRTMKVPAQPEQILRQGYGQTLLIHLGYPGVQRHSSTGNSTVALVFVALASVALKAIGLTSTALASSKVYGTMFALETCKSKKRAIDSQIVCD